MFDRSSPTGQEDELLRQFCAEMHLHLLAGLPVSAEVYLRQHAWLANDPERAIRLILAEFALRRQMGQAVDPSAWLVRFPAWAPVLREHFAAMQALPTPGRTADTCASGTVPLSVLVPVRPSDELPKLSAHVLLDCIGEGGMGTVYRARDTALGREVALKRLHASLAAPGHLARFYREARAAASLNHPHIVPILAVGLFEGEVAYTMPLIPGGNLSGQMSRFHKDLRALARIMIQVARAMHYAHENGIVHRDLKPGNILLNAQGEPLVTDFGLAKFTSGEDDLTLPGQTLGTPAYMSPEQAAGHGHAVTHASDIWSLGVILYQAAVGQRPFQSASNSELRRQIAEADPILPSVRRGDVPADLEAIILRCLEKVPADRYPSAGALADDLERWLEGQAIQATPPSPWRRVESHLRRWQPAAPVALMLFVPLLLLPLLGGGTRSVSGKEKPAATEAARREAVLAQVHEEMAAGRTAELVGMTGGPRMQRWRSEPNRAPLPMLRQRPLSITAWTTSLLELMQTPGRDAYELSARMRLMQPYRSSYHGVYLLHDEEVRHGVGEQRFFTLRLREQGDWLEFLECCFVRYHDWDKRELQETARLQTRRINPLVWLAATTTGLGAAGPLGPLAIAQTLCTSSLQSGRWREVRVRISPTQVDAFVDGWPAGGFEWKRQRSLIRGWWAGSLRLPAERMPPPPPFAVRGGLGLFVCRCAIDVGPVRIRALPQP